MSVSGLAITLSNGAQADAAVRALAAHASLELGSRQGRHLAATADTPSPQADRALLDWMTGLAGVEHVDVVFVHFDEDEPESHP